MPSRDTQWIIGAILTGVLALSIQIAGLRTDIRGLDDRLRAVEVEVAKVEQRLVTLEQLVLQAETARLRPLLSTFLPVGASVHQRILVKNDRGTSATPFVTWPERPAAATRFSVAPRANPSR